MPKKMHRALRRAAKKKGLKGKKADRYTYGAMAKRRGGKSKRATGARSY